MSTIAQMLGLEHEGARRNDRVVAARRDRGHGLDLFTGTFELAAARQEAVEIRARQDLAASMILISKSPRRGAVGRFGSARVDAPAQVAENERQPVIVGGLFELTGEMLRRPLVVARLSSDFVEAIG